MTVFRPENHVGCCLIPIRMEFPSPERGQNTVRGSIVFRQLRGGCVQCGKFYLYSAHPHIFMPQPTIDVPDLSNDIADEITLDIHAEIAPSHEDVLVHVRAFIGENGTAQFVEANVNVPKRL